MSILEICVVLLNQLYRYTCICNKIRNFLFIEINGISRTSNLKVYNLRDFFTILI